MFLVIFCLLISLLYLRGFYCLFWLVNIYGVYPLYILFCLECTLVAARESVYQFNEKEDFACTPAAVSQGSAGGGLAVAGRRY
jgi:hypothetical protein